MSDWLTRHAYGKLSDGTCAVLVEAGIEEGEWLQELIAIEQVIPTPSHLVDRISPISSPFFPRFLPVSSRFLRVFTVSPRRFQRAASRNGLVLLGYHYSI